MSHAKTPPTNDELNEEERELFERLADEFADDDIGRVFELALQSSDSDNENREASS